MTLVKFNQRPSGFGSLINDLFNEVPANWSVDWNGRYAYVPVNIHETNEGFHLELVAPGREKDDFRLNEENGTLTISYEKKETNGKEDQKTVTREFSLESFSRSFNLGQKINTDEIQAKYEHGILKLFLPKKAEVKPKQISIQ